MKKLFIPLCVVVLVVLMLATYCGGQNSNKPAHNPPPTYEVVAPTSAPPTPAETIDTEKKQEELFSEFKKLYTELKNFKGKADFIQLGFGAASPYNKWLKSVQALVADKHSTLLASNGLLAAELEQLGYAYVSSKGKENDVTKFFNDAFAKAINKKAEQPTPAVSGDAEYDKIRKEYELFGKWSVTHAPSKLNYVYEVYKKGTTYVGVILDKKTKIERLEKRGTKYLLKGSTAGEYYVIDSNKNMSLWDRSGNLADVGFRVSKL